MVDGQVHPLQIALGVFGKQAPRRQVHRHDESRGEVLRGSQTLQVGGEERSRVGIFQHISGFALLPQGLAQPGGTADGIAVRAQVGQD